TSTRIRFEYLGGVSLWSGAVHLTRGGRRPIFVIGHNRNTPEAVEQALDRGRPELSRRSHHGRRSAAAAGLEGNLGSRRLASTYAGDSRSLGIHLHRLQAAPDPGQRFLSVRPG